MNDLVGEGRDIGHGEITEANYLDSKSQSFNQIIQCGFLLEGMQWLHAAIERYLYPLLLFRNYFNFRYFFDSWIVFTLVSDTPCLWDLRTFEDYTLQRVYEYVT